MLRHLPNALSGLRLLAAPALAFLLVHGAYTYAFGLFALAGLSDAVDGYLAKRLAPGSRFGAYLDPAADKLLMLAAFLALATLEIVPRWLTALVIARDVAIVLGLLLIRAYALSVPMTPLPVGKASTAVQVGYIGLVLLNLAFGFVAPALLSAGVILVAVVTAASWVAYGQVLIRAFALRRRTA
jgi:cardiolipin synthase